MRSLLIAPLAAGAAMLPAASAAQVRAVSEARSLYNWVPVSRTDETGKLRASGQSIHSYLGGVFDSTASSFAYGDLAAGKMGASASSNGAGTASGEVTMDEKLSFYIPGATSTQSTLVKFSIGLDGFLGASFSTAPSSFSFIEYNFQAGQDFDFRSYNVGDYYLSQVYNKNGPNIVNSAVNWKSSDIFPANGNTVGTLTLEIFGERPSVTIRSSLKALTVSDAFSDYSHTASLNLAVPTGVTWSSRSGAFLSQVGSVPEPATWIMMILGFGAVGGAMRRRQKNMTSVRFV